MDRNSWVDNAKWLWLRYKGKLKGGTEGGGIEEIGGIEGKGHKRGKGHKGGQEVLTGTRTVIEIIKKMLLLLLNSDHLLYLLNIDNVIVVPYKSA